jgi:hypothetical protein
MFSDTGQVNGCRRHLVGQELCSNQHNACRIFGESDASIRVYLRISCPRCLARSATTDRHTEGAVLIRSLTAVCRHLTDSHKHLINGSATVTDVVRTNFSRQDLPIQAHAQLLMFCVVLRFRQWRVQQISLGPSQAVGRCFSKKKTDDVLDAATPVKACYYVPLISRSSVWVLWPSGP